MKFICEDDRLIVQLEGLEQLWALKRRLEIPRAAIETVQYAAHAPTLQDFHGYLRFPGTAVPWRFLAGSYIRRGNREFWYVHLQQPGLMVIRMLPGSFAYGSIRLSCRPDIAQAVVGWSGNAK